VLGNIAPRYWAIFKNDDDISITQDIDFTNKILGN
jgi:hypothetical protein